MFSIFSVQFYLLSVYCAVYITK